MFNIRHDVKRKTVEGPPNLNDPITVRRANHRRIGSLRLHMSLAYCQHYFMVDIKNSLHVIVEKLMQNFVPYMPCCFHFLCMLQVQLAHVPHSRVYFVNSMQMQKSDSSVGGFDFKYYFNSLPSSGNLRIFYLLTHFYSIQLEVQYR